MKKSWKILFSAIAFSLTGVLSFLSSKQMEYLQNIPVKYLLSGVKDDTNQDTTFDFYLITNTADLNLDSSKRYYAIALKDSFNSSNPISIPSTYNDSEVIGIYKNGFSNRTNLNLTNGIPSSIQYIDYEAFFNTSFSNKNLIIPKSVKELGVASFFNTNIINLSFTEQISDNEKACTDLSIQADTSTDSSDEPIIKEIPPFCFAKCKNLKSITLPISLKAIDEEAFEFCSSLQALACLSNLSQIKNRAFRGCSSLKEVYLPDAITKDNLDSFAFENCNNDLKIKINTATIEDFTLRKSQFTPDTYAVEQYSSNVMASGSWIYNLTNDSKVNLMRYIGEVPSSGILACPNQMEGKDVTSLSTDCFQDKESSINRLYFPYHLSIINENFFTNKYKNLVYIGSMSKNNCYSDTTKDNVIDLSALEDLETIGASSFSNLPNKTNVNTIKLPGNLTSIGEKAFYDSFKKVNTLSFEETTKKDLTNPLNIGESAFRNVGYNLNPKTAKYTNKILLPERTTSIGENAFYQAKCVTHLTIKGSENSPQLTINKEAFKNNTALQSVIIEPRGKATVTLNDQAFANWADEGDYNYQPTLQLVYLPKNTTFVKKTNDFAVFDRQYRSTIYTGNNTGFSESDFGLGFDDSISDFTGGQDTLANENPANWFNFKYRPNQYANVGYGADSGFDSFVYDTADFTYVINKKENTAIVSKYHFDARNHDNKSKWSVDVPEKVTIDNIDYTVTEIGDNAFVSSDSYNLIYNKINNDKVPQSNSETTFRTVSQVTLPDTITRIGHYAFFRCVGLEKIGIKNTFNMPSALKEIGEHAFSFSGITEITDLNKDCQFQKKYMNYDSSDSQFPSPFTNCPYLQSITLKDTSSTATSGLKADKKCLMDSSNNVWVVFPKAQLNENDTSFSFTSNAVKFHYDAFKCANWIKSLTIYSSNYPTNGSKIIPHSLFLGYADQQAIREKCCFKGRNRRNNESYPTLSEGITDATIILELGSDNSISIPENAFLKCSISKIILPYGGGHGTIPSSLLANLSNLKTQKGLIIQVKKSDGELSNSEENSGFLDLEGCGYETIGDKAFKGLSILTKVNLTGIKTIGKEAFAGTGITDELKLPSSIETLNSNCFDSTPITSLDVSSTKLTSIPDGAFNNCTNLSSVKLNGNINSIGSNAFNKTALTSFEVPSSLESIGESAFANCSSLNSLTFEKSENPLTIGDSAFANCSSLKKLELINRPMTIGDSCFTGCSSLESVTIGKDVTSIGSSAFASLTKLTTLTFETSGKTLTIDDKAFSYTSIKSLDLSRITSIGNNAFLGCNTLSSIKFGSNITSIGQDAFKQTAIEEADLSKCTSLKNLHGFAECKELVKVLLPNNITSISSWCFGGCTNLKTVTVDESRYNRTIDGIILPSSITSIGDHAFSSCSSFALVKIEGAINSIGSNAFENCTSMTRMFILACENGNFLGDSILSGCQSLQYLVLPSNFNMNTSAKLVWGLTKFQNEAYICLDRGAYTFGTTTPQWLKISVAQIAKYAFKTGSIYTWEFDDDKENVTIKSNNTTSNTIYQIQYYLDSKRFF